MRLPVGARAGTGSWLVQRASAIVLAILIPLLAGRALAAMPAGFAAWQALWAPPWVRVAVLLCGVAWAMHAWIGMRDILMDYVPAIALRLVLYLAVGVTLAASVAWLEVVVWRLP